MVNGDSKEKETPLWKTFVGLMSGIAVLLAILSNVKNGVGAWLFDTNNTQRLRNTLDPTRVDDYLYPDIMGSEFKYPAVARHEIDELESTSIFNVFIYGAHGVGKSTILNQVAWRVRKQGSKYFYFHFLAHTAAEDSDCVYLKKVFGLKGDYRGYSGIVRRTI